MVSKTLHKFFPKQMKNRSKLKQDHIRKKQICKRNKMEKSNAFNWKESRAWKTCKCGEKVKLTS